MPSAQVDKGQDKHHNHDQADKVNDGVHRGVSTSLLVRISHRRRVHRSPDSGKVVVWQRLLEPAEGTPMPTECSVDLFGFASVEGRRVEAGFDGGTISSDAGAGLLGATDRAVGVVER